MVEEIGAELKGALQARFRAGKKPEGAEARPRPLIVKIEDDETREKVLKDARNLSRKDGWKKVFVAPDLTYEQREEARKIEREMREEAERKPEEARGQGKEEKYIVIGQRGKRRVIRVAA